MLRRKFCGKNPACAKLQNVSGNFKMTPKDERMKHIFNRIYLKLALIPIIFCSCATERLNSLIERDICNQQNSYQYTRSEIPKPIYEKSIDTLLFSSFNLSDLNAANAIGVLDLLTDYLIKLNISHKDSSIQNQLQLLRIQQKLNQQIDLASLEISAVTSELDCEEERINQIASFLKDKEGKTQTHLTVASIILGAAGTIATGVVIKDNQTANVVGVSTALVGTGLAVLMLTTNRKVYLSHSRNVLREIWFATDTSTVYPPSIWYYLNYANQKVKGEISIREQLIENWKSFGQVKEHLNDTNKNETDIYFKDGGKYTTSQLVNRAQMYDQIESAIKLMKQDLRNLTLKIAALE